METKPTIELPRHENESARAYAARREYVLMGAARSIEKVAERAQSAPKALPTKRLATLKKWSVLYNWTDSARQYDEQISYLTVQESAEQYRADLADYRKRYGDTGKALHGVAMKLLRKMNTTLDTVTDVGPGNMALVTNAVKTAADLEALALRVEHLLNEPGSE